jgi:hypothetical protein
LRIEHCFGSIGSLLSACGGFRYLYCCFLSCCSDGPDALCIQWRKKERLNGLFRMFSLLRRSVFQHAARFDGAAWLWVALLVLGRAVFAAVLPMTGDEA